MKEQRLLTPPVEHFRIALVLAGASMISVLLAMPYLFAFMSPQMENRIPVPLPVFTVVQVLQAGVLVLLLGWAGLRMGYAMGLDVPLLRHWLNAGAAHEHSSLWLASISVGVVVGVIIILLLLAANALSPDAAATMSVGPAWWKGLLASFYGGVVEEVLCRLFLVSLLVWLAAHVLHTAAPGASVYWAAIALAALIFGILHLPAVAQTTALTNVVVLRTVALNALAGIIFGWLFWRRGLEQAMAAHFSADLVLHVAAPLFP